MGCCISGEGEGGGADGLEFNPLEGMFIGVFGPVYPGVWFTRFSGRKSFPRGDARTASITPGVRLKRSARGTHMPPEAQVNTPPKAKSKTRSKQNKDMHKCSSAYSERGAPLPVLTSGRE